MELVHLVLPSGKALPEHRVSGEITVQCIEGLIAFTTPTSQPAPGTWPAWFTSPPVSAHACSPWRMSHRAC